MIARILSYAVFAVLMTLSITGSAVVVVLLYLPMVALKAVWQIATGKAAPKTKASDEVARPAAG